MAKSPVTKSSGSSVAKTGMGPKLIGIGAALFVLTRIINWLPLGWVDGPINAVLWLGIVASVAAGAGLMFLKAKRS